MNRWLPRQARKVVRRLGWLDRYLKALLDRLRTERKGREVLDRLEHALDALEGRYTILINDLPPEPGMSIGQGDHVTILGDGPDYEIEAILEGIGRTDLECDIEEEP